MPSASSRYFGAPSSSAANFRRDCEASPVWRPGLADFRSESDGSGRSRVVAKPSARVLQHEQSSPQPGSFRRDRGWSPPHCIFLITFRAGFRYLKCARELRELRAYP